MTILHLTGLLRMDLPGHTVRLCDGGLIRWGSDSYVGADALFGTVRGVESLTEGVGDELPNLQMTLLPPATTPIATLTQPGYQTSRVRFWIGTYDPATGAISGTPDLQFDGQVDQTELMDDGSVRALQMTIVSNAARLINRNEGNSLSPTWHKSVWPGEAGHDQATGLTVSVAWGVAAPVSSTPYGGVAGAARYYRDMQ